MNESWSQDLSSYEALVDGLRSGDEETFERFVRLFAAPAMQIARRLLRNEADAADAVQDAFVSAMSSIHQFRADSQFATWFHRVVTNSALMKLRSNRRKDVRSLEELGPSFHPDGHRIGPKPAWTESPEQLLAKAERRQKVHEKISQLPENSRNILLLRDIQQVSTSEAARQLGVSESVVKTRLHRARQALRTLLEEEFVVA